MNLLKPNEKIYWENYLQTLPEDKRPLNPNLRSGQAGNAAITDSLLELYIEGKKVQAVGNFWIYLNSHGQPSCILKTEKVITYKFKDVSPAIAIAEGEGDLTVEFWKRVHSELYLPYLKAWRIDDINNATVITEFFSIVHK